jgi:hypothetical protein
VIVGTTVAERVAYLPSLGVAMCFGLFLGCGPMESFKPILPFYYLFPFSPSPPSTLVQLKHEMEGKLINHVDDDDVDVDDDDDDDEKKEHQNTDTSGGENITLSAKKKEEEKEEEAATIAVLQDKWSLGWRSRYGRWVVLLTLLSAMVQKCVERNFAWTNQVELWAAAFDVNPRR